MAGEDGAGRGSQTYGAAHFRRFARHDDPLLLRMEKEAGKRGIPIVGPEMGRLLALLAGATGARRVLEIGTSTGYSAIWLARAVERAGGKVTTIERDESVAEEARKNLAAAGVAKRVDVVVGDALEWMATSSKKRKGHYDMAFNDIDKELYSASLDPLVELVHPGGLLVFDNTAFRSAGDFLERSCSHPLLETVHLHCFLPGHAPDLDAITICLKKGRGNR